MTAPRKTGTISASDDVREAMAKRARRNSGLWRRLTGRYGFACGDAERLPLASASVDMIVSNLALQWANDPLQCFQQWRRVLKPDGQLSYDTVLSEVLRRPRKRKKIAAPPAIAASGAMTIM